MHAGEHDHVGLGFHRHPRQRQAVADQVGDAMEDFRRLVIMRENDRIAAPLQRGDRLDVAGESGPFDRRDDAAHAIVKRVGARNGTGL